MGTVLHRLRQFREASAEPTPAELALAREICRPERLFELFAAQDPRDMVHGVRTAQWLIDRGHDDSLLLMAALLHDIGKGRQRTRDRVAWVVAEATHAGGWLASAESRFAMRQALARSAKHSAVGAAMLRDAGAPDGVVELTRLHHDPPGQNGMLAILQAADAAS
jgi:putative nucleotidyltransferase with HDIG domain